MNTEFPFLSLDCSRTAVSVDSKKRIIELFSDLLSQNSGDIDQETIYNALLNRERLGSTGIGHGVALPHARLATLQTPLAALVCLDHPIHFDALDDQPVDLFYTLLVPDVPSAAHPDADDGYLEYIAKMASAFRDPLFRTQLRKASTNKELLNFALNFFKEHSHD